MTTAYNKLHSLSQEAALLSSIHGLLEWDQETYMPQGSIAFRAKQLEAMAHLAHKQKTNRNFARALAALIDLESGEILNDQLSAAQVAALRQWRRDYLKESRVSPRFVKKLAGVASHATHAWAEAKRHSDFKAFTLHLEKIVSLLRKKADMLGFREHPYDALLDLYEPDMTIATLTPLFERLKIALKSLLLQISASTPPDISFLHGEFSPARQLQFAQTLLKAMGFEATNSRLDQSSHPFCSNLHPTDTRMTTKIHPDAVMSSIFSVLHEGGHGVYNLGLPQEHFGSPLGESASLGIDESQSRLWETIIGRGLPFWQCYFPLLQRTFPEQLQGISLDDFYRAINYVKPSFIRIEADEVTYSLHILVRFEIEKGLIEGSLQVKEIPYLWNTKMREYLGVSPERDDEGCLQDIHWAMGVMGYFPTYVLGNLYAAQFFHAFEKGHPDWKEKTSRGELSLIRNWLKTHIHSHGRQYSPLELIQRVTHSPLSEKPFVHYLEQKYKGLYRL